MNKNYRLKQVSAGLRGELWIRKDEHQQDFMCGPLQDQPTQQPFQEEQSLKPFLVPSYRLNKNGIVITPYSHQSTDIYQIYFYPHPFDAFRSHKWWINHHVQILMVFLEKNISGLAAIAQLFMVKLPSNIDRHVSWLNKHCSAVAVNFPIKTWIYNCFPIEHQGWTSHLVNLPRYGNCAEKHWAKWLVFGSNLVRNLGESAATRVGKDGSTRAAIQTSSWMSVKIIQHL